MVYKPLTMHPKQYGQHWAFTIIWVSRCLTNHCTMGNCLCISDGMVFILLIVRRALYLGRALSDSRALLFLEITQHAKKHGNGESVQNVCCLAICNNYIALAFNQSLYVGTYINIGSHLLKDWLASKWCQRLESFYEFTLTTGGYFSSKISGIINPWWRQCFFNSLRHSDAIWRHRSGSTLAKVMACCLTAPSLYLN